MKNIIKNFTKDSAAKQIIFFGFLSAFIVVSSNILVQFNIADSTLTYGALTYPFCFLLLDIVGEKYGKKTAFNALKFGIFLAVIPSIFLATPRIAMASITAFVISQYAVLFAFFKLKNAFPKLWWLRTNASELLAQLADKFLFFTIAFLGIYEAKEVILMALSDYLFCVLLSVIHLPIFYFFAIKKGAQKRRIL